MPQNLSQHFGILATSQIITPELGVKMRAMTGFRNIAVHEYKNIDLDILKRILEVHLQDLEDYYQTLLAHYDL